ERRANRCAEAADVGRGLHVVDREATADVERVAGAELFLARFGEQLAARLDGFDVLARIGGLRTHMERQAAYVHAKPRREAGQRYGVFRVAPELARQIAHRTGAAERHAQQQLRAPGVRLELAHFIGVVGDEDAHAEFERVANIAVALDRMGVDAALRIEAEPLHELHFARRREIEEGALLAHRLHHRRMGQGLQGVVQIDARQGLAQLPELHAHALAVDDEQGRAELLHEPPDLGWLEGIDEAAAPRRAFHEHDRYANP